MAKGKDRLRFTRKLKDLAREKGADLIGIAPVERLGAAPLDQRPTHFLPEAQAVISMAILVNRSGLKAILSGTSIYSYCLWEGQGNRVPIQGTGAAHRDAPR